MTDKFSDNVSMVERHCRKFTEVIYGGIITVTLSSISMDEGDDVRSLMPSLCAHHFQLAYGNFHSLSFLLELPASRHTHMHTDKLNSFICLQRKQKRCDTRRWYIYTHFHREVKL